MSDIRFLRVAAAVIFDRDGRVLLTRRMPGTPYPGYWEFPGGKLEAGEAPRDALARELEEELGIRITRSAPWLTREYVYPHARVELNFFRVFAWNGDAHGREGQAMAWQRPGSFDVSPLLPANALVLRALELPAIYGISIAEDLGEAEFLARARVAVEAGLRLIQLREKTLSRTRLAALADALLEIARPSGARVLLNGDAETARALGCAGVHWTSAALSSATERPPDMLCGASCHDAHELAHAARIGVDFAVLGPVCLTPLHGAPIGWQRFANMTRVAGIPVYALGGLCRSDLDGAVNHGAHGIALRRDAWSVR